MSSAPTKADLMTSEEWIELGELFKDWKPYTERIKKRSKSQVEKYLYHMYDVECSYKNKVDFYINKIVYRTLIVMTYRSELINLGLTDADEVRRGIIKEIERLLLRERGEFSKNPSKNMRESDRRVFKLCEKYLKSIGMWIE